MNFSHQMASPMVAILIFMPRDAKSAGAQASIVDPVVMMSSPARYAYFQTLRGDLRLKYLSHFPNAAFISF
jgi:D-serine dehydratase